MSLSSPMVSTLWTTTMSRMTTFRVHTTRSTVSQTWITTQVSQIAFDFYVDYGITMIVSPKWVFVSVLTNPYSEFKGMPVYVDAYAYTGVFNIQVTEKQWPATAGLVDDQLMPYQVLERSAQDAGEPSKQVLSDAV